MVNQLNPTIVPDSSLKCVPTQSCLIRTAVLLYEWCRLPGVELNWLGFEAPWCMLTVCFRLIFHGHARELRRESVNYAIVIGRVVIVGVVQSHHIVHVRVE